MKKKLHIKSRLGKAITITRDAFKAERLVYIGCANKKIKYSLDRSRIAYIGTTKKGAQRVAASAVWKGADVLFEHGINYLEFHIVTCTKRQNVETWKKLETALIIRFRELFGDPPRGNDKGKKKKWTDEQQYFTQSALDAVLKKHS
jgi:hypothetical protein